MTLCPFCDTTQNYRYVYEGNLLRAIYPKAPACRHHVLLVPKRHVQQLDQLTVAESAELFSMLRYVVGKATAGLPGFIGFNILSNNGGPAVRQHVPHCHMHVFLRTAQDHSDPLRPGDSNTPPPLSDEQLTNMHELRQLFAR